MGRVVSIADPSNASIQHPIALEDNAVSLSGWCSDEGSIRNNSLVALTDAYGMIQALYEGYNFTTESFPIGCNIYCYIGNNNISDCNIINNIVVDSGDLFETKLNFYSSYYDLSINVNGGDYDNYFANGDDVFLKVNIDATGTKWTPVALVGSSHLIEKYFYIRLGAYTGDTSSQSQSMADKFMLEDNNPLYYYDGTNLIEYSVWLAKQNQPGTTSFFKNFKLSNTTHYFSHGSASENFDWLNATVTYPAGLYLFSGYAILVNNYGKPLKAHVLLTYGPNQIIVASGDYTIPDDTDYGAVTISLQGIVNIPVNSVVQFGMRFNVESPNGTENNYAYIPSDSPLSGTYADNFNSGAQMFIQRVGDALAT